MLLVGPKVQDTFSEQLSGQGTETENGKPGARDTYLTGRITEEISVQERTPREALSGYLCAERGVRIGGCVAIHSAPCPLQLRIFFCIFAFISAIRAYYYSFFLFLYLIYII